MASGLNRPAGSLDIRTALEPYRGTWNDRLAAHLLRRAGFGGSPTDIGRFTAMNAHDAVETLIHFSDTSLLPEPDVMPNPIAQLQAARQMTGTDMTKRQAVQDIRKQARESTIGMQLWWLNRMLATPAPLQEKMTLFFHGHFTTAAIEKGVWPNYVYQQNKLYRDNALGNLRDLTLAVSQNPAMLIYLDNASSNKAHPNENYARELMELFTLGHGNYSEEDIRQSARAFTGWSLDRSTGEFTINTRAHDTGTKTFLGKTGNFDGSDIVSIIYQQPACARFWANSLLGFFVYDDPEPELVEAFAAVIVRNDFNLAPSMSRLLQSNVFFSDRAYRALIKSPAEFVVGVHKALELQQIELRSLRAMPAMGQALFYPPNVAGWPGGTNWLTSQTLIARENFAVSLIRSPLADQSQWLSRVPTMPTEADRAAHEIAFTILQNDAPAQAFAQLVDYIRDTTDVRGAAYLTMAMPAYQLA